jgi:hypothetical protein
VTRAEGESRVGEIAKFNPIVKPGDHPANQVRPSAPAERLTALFLDRLLNDAATLPFGRRGTSSADPAWRAGISRLDLALPGRS